jgi:transcriptional regulator with XRE-family HTH domain
MNEVACPPVTPFRPLEQTKARTPLARMRLKRRVTQKQMWEATGISRSAYMRMERGEHPNPPIRYIANCAIALGCDIEELIQDEWREWWVRAPGHEPAAPPTAEEFWGEDDG